MYISVNANNEIKKVGITTDPSLVSIYVNDEHNPFVDWSEAKICCYKVNVNDEGVVTMMTPYIDSRLLDHFDQIGTSTEINRTDISDNRDGLMETFETSLINTDDISSLREGLEEVYEMLLESEETE